VNPSQAVERNSVSLVLRGLMTNLDHRPDRARAPSARLTGSNVPEFGEQREPDEAETTWRAFLALEKAGLISIKLPRPKTGYAIHELEPIIQLVSEAAERTRELLGMAKPGDSRSKIWADAARTVFPGEPALQQTIAARWLEIPGKSTMEIMSQLRKLRDMPSGTFLRQVSARLFWGDSKILDAREALICEILGADESPFPEAPVQLQVFAPTNDFDRVIFIENVETFEFLKSVAPTHTSSQRPPFPVAGAALVQGYGFRGSAKRVRRVGGSSIYFDANDDARRRFSTWLYDNASGVVPYFYGDLDFAGMSILKAMREIFPAMTCWVPGYAAMLREIQSGNGHPHSTSKKKKQGDPGSIGCEYADAVLLPAMRSTGLFFDQEGILVAAAD
jgi:hypothetical protein